MSRTNNTLPTLYSFRVVLKDGSVLHTNLLSHTHDGLISTSTKDGGYGRVVLDDIARISVDNGKCRFCAGTGGMWVLQGMWNNDGNSRDEWDVVRCGGCTPAPNSR